MTEALAHILQEVENLSAPERAELADRLMDTWIGDFPAEIERAHLDGVRRRVVEVDSGAVTLVAGDQVLAEGRRIIAAARRAG